MSDAYDKWVGNQLKHYRLKNNLTLEEVGLKIGRSKKQVQNYEIGESRLYLPLLIELCRIYDIDYRKLINESISYLESEEL